MISYWKEKHKREESRPEKRVGKRERERAKDKTSKTALLCLCAIVREDYEKSVSFEQMSLLVSMSAHVSQDVSV